MDNIQDPNSEWPVQKDHPIKQRTSSSHWISNNSDKPKGRSSWNVCNLVETNSNWFWTIKGNGEAECRAPVINVLSWCQNRQHCELCRNLGNAVRFRFLFILQQLSRCVWRYMARNKRILLREKPVMAVNCCINFTSLSVSSCFTSFNVKNRRLESTKFTFPC